MPLLTSRYTAPDLEAWGEAFHALARMNASGGSPDGTHRTQRTIAVLAAQWPEWAPKPQQIHAWAQVYDEPDEPPVLPAPGLKPAIDEAMMRVIVALTIHHGPKLAAYYAETIAGDIGIDDRWWTSTIRVRANLTREFFAARLLAAAA